MSGFLESASIIIASIAAIYGIDSWRTEFVGRRRIELAEEVLAKFYEARDFMKSMRAPMSSGDEWESRKAPSYETEEEKRARDTAYVIYHRYESKRELFSSLFALRYRFRAYFGDERAKPFEELDNVVRDVLLAARMLPDLWIRARSNPPAADHNSERVSNLESKIWWSDLQNDKIEQELDRVVRDMEISCRAVIDSSVTSRTKQWLSKLKWRP